MNSLSHSEKSMQILRSLNLAILLFVGCGSDNFSNVAELTPMIKSAQNVQLHEGLPHPNNDKKFFDSELKTAETTKRSGFYFYAKPITLKGAGAKALTQFVKSGKAFKAWTGEKKCGGFHPDFTATWTSPKGEVEIQFCFGCREAKLIHLNSSVRCDLTETAYNSLSEFLNPYHVHLPKTPAVRF